MTRFRFAVATGALVLAAMTAGSAPALLSRPALSCAGAIDWSRAGQAIGRVATIRGPVAGAFFASSSTGSPTFLDLGARYPSPRRFTVVIWIENRRRFGAPERTYRGKMICVRGTVSTYRGIPQIQARSPAQIHIVG